MTAPTPDTLKQLFEQASAKCKALETIGVDIPKAAEAASAYIFNLADFVSSGMTNEKLKAELLRSHSPAELGEMLDAAHDMARAEMQRSDVASFLKSLLPLLVEAVINAAR